MEQAENGCMQKDLEKFTEMRKLDRGEKQINMMSWLKSSCLIEGMTQQIR